MSAAQQPSGLLTEITQHLGGIFRHMLPGILVVGCARIAYPCWFVGVDLKSWQQVVVLAAISVALGNTWFVLNRYGVRQVVDYLLYSLGSNGPARGSRKRAYLDDLGRYTYRSLHTPEASARARQHVAFRASTVLLALTAGELLVASSAAFHANNSPFEGPGAGMTVGGVLAISVGFWQMVITRRIDYYVVNPPSADSLHHPHAH